MPDDTHRFGGVCYIEIPAPDVDLAKRFYTAALGWRVEDSDLGDARYAMFEAGPDTIGGLDSRMQPATTGVLLYLNVADIPATLQAIRDAGGAVVADKAPVIEGRDDYGFAATFTDPNGNRLGLWSKV